jgi:hypothetical protein
LRLENGATTNRSRASISLEEGFGTTGLTIGWKIIFSVNDFAARVRLVQPLLIALRR